MEPDDELRLPFVYVHDTNAERRVNPFLGAPSAQERSERLARFRRFGTLASVNGFRLQAIEVPYLQPPLSADTEQEGPPHLLIIGRPKKSSLSSVSRQQAERILESIYVRLYPSCYSDDPVENDSFRLTCRNFFTKIIQNLPPKVNLLVYRALYERRRDDHANWTQARIS